MPRGFRGLELILIGIMAAVGAIAWELSALLVAAETHVGHEEAVVHNAVATVVVILGVLLAAVGTRLILRSRFEAPEGYALLVASSAMFADGILHLEVVGEHLQILPYAIFFVAAGGTQLALGFGLLRARPLVYLVSSLVTIMLIVIFFVARFVALPFSEGVESFEAIGLLSKALEFAALSAVVFLLARWRDLRAEVGGRKPSGG